MGPDSLAHTIDYELLAEYLRQLWSQQPARSIAEQALNVLLKGRAQSATLSISDKMTTQGTRLHPSCRQWGLILIYGDARDWMGSHNGRDFVDTLNKLGKQDIYFSCVENAGHQLFNENQFESQSP